MLVPGVLICTSDKVDDHANAYGHDNDEEVGEVFHEPSLRDEVAVCVRFVVEVVTGAHFAGVSESAHETVHPDEEENQVCEDIEQEKGLIQ